MIGLIQNGPNDGALEAQLASTLESIEKLERYLDEAEFIAASSSHRGIVILALFSKSLTVSRAICCLVQGGFSEEAFGMVRTLTDIYFTVRYISNNHTEERSTRFAEFFAKDQEGWEKIVRKYYPHLSIPDNSDRDRILELARNYKQPHEWSGEPQKTRSLAIEPDTYEFDSNGEGTTAEFDYEVLFKMTSHYVHSTVCALDSHAGEVGDRFRVRAGWVQNRRAKFALFNVLAMVSKTFVCGFRALRHDQPEDILNEMHSKMQAYK